MDLELTRRVSRVVLGRRTDKIGSGLFVVWARCVWDKKIRGFLIEKVCWACLDVGHPWLCFGIIGHGETDQQPRMREMDPNG